MSKFDVDRWAGMLRGAADMMQSREKRLEFKQRFGEAAARTLIEQLKKRGVSASLLEEIRRDLDL